MMARERGWCCDLGYRPKRFSDEPEYAAGWGVRTVGAKGSPGSPGLELEESEEMRGAPPAPKTEKAGSGAGLSASNTVPRVSCLRQHSGWVRTAKCRGSTG